MAVDPIFCVRDAWQDGRLSLSEDDTHFIFRDGITLPKVGGMPPCAAHQASQTCLPCRPCTPCILVPMRTWHAQAHHWRLGACLQGLQACSEWLLAASGLQDSPAWAWWHEGPSHAQDPGHDPAPQGPSPWKVQSNRQGHLRHHLP